jgi:hypothetical protein
MSAISEPDVLIAQKSSKFRIINGLKIVVCLGEIRSVQETATAHAYRGKYGDGEDR